MAIIMDSEGLAFDTVEDARAWILTQIDNDPYMDNERFAYMDNSEEVAEYHKIYQLGCCGFYDMVAFIGGRKAMIGCNYGH